MREFLSLKGGCGMSEAEVHVRLKFMCTALAS